MSLGKLVAGLVLMAIGVSISLWSFLTYKQPLQKTGENIVSTETRIQYLERRGYTYLLDQSFLLKNPQNNTVCELVYVWTPVNASNQFVKLIETSVAPLHKKVDKDGAEILVFNVSLPAGGTIWINMTLQVTVEAYSLLMENIPWLNLSQVEENTGGKKYWAVENETYIALAKEIGLNARDPISASWAIGKWIVDNKIYTPMWRRGAEQALIIENGSLKVFGDCEEVADVFVTLTRILGVRSRVAHGIYILEGDKDVTTMWIKMTDRGLELSNNWGGHAWPQIYVPQVGWVDVELLEEDVVKIGNFSQYHVKYGFEEKSFLGSTILYCRSMFLETNALYFTFRRIES
ncbi:MAG: transglutaminase domain-containing protein [Candidatus Brockarchaeota archaeon]|nr:transglutaminase domain-containing protein [Candidatus Brockarchaeota archaeon]